MKNNNVESRLVVFSSAVVFCAALLAVILVLPQFAKADTLSRQLQVGMSGSDVSALQTFLAQDNTIYPQGLVTGYFGTLTKAAVSNWQSRNGIASVGRVGPITLVAMNAQMGGGSTVALAEGAGKVTRVDVPQPILSNLAVTTTSNSATVTWTSNVPGTAKVWYSTNPSFNYNTAPSATTAGFTTAENVVISNLQGNTTYYYAVESLDAQGNFSWSQVGNSFKTQ